MISTYIFYILKKIKSPIYITLYSLTRLLCQFALSLQHAYDLCYICLSDHPVDHYLIDYVVQLPE